MHQDNIILTKISRKNSIQNYCQ